MNVELIRRTFEVRDAKGRLVITPGYTVTFYIAAARAPDVLEELLLAAGRTLAPHVSHATYRHEGDYKKWDAAAYAEHISTWCQRPGAGKTYEVTVIGGADKEASPALLWAEFDLRPPPIGKPRTRVKFENDTEKLAAMMADAVAKGQLSAEEAHAKMALVRENYERVAAGYVAPPSACDAHVHIGFPFEAFSSPSDFRDWLLSRAASASENLVSANAGVGLTWWQDPYDLDYELNELSLKRLSGMLLRHPTLDWEDRSVIRRRRLVTPADGADERYVKRARWLNIVHDGVISRAGGLETVRRESEEHPLCSLDTVGASYVIRAGESPDPTGENGEALLDASRCVNRLLRLAQITKYEGPFYAPKDFSDSFLSLGEISS